MLFALQLSSRTEVVNTKIRFSEDHPSESNTTVRRGNLHHPLTKRNRFGNRSERGIVALHAI